jgi:hypothetical protein
MRLKYRYVRHVAEIARSGRITSVQGQYLLRKTGKRARRRLKRNSVVAQTTTHGPSKTVDEAIARREEARARLEKTTGRKVLP